MTIAAVHGPEAVPPDRRDRARRHMTRRSAPCVGRVVRWHRPVWNESDRITAHRRPDVCGSVTSAASDRPADEEVHRAGRVASSSGARNDGRVRDEATGVDRGERHRTGRRRSHGATGQLRHSEALDRVATLAIFVDRGRVVDVSPPVSTETVTPRT